MTIDNRNRHVADIDDLRQEIDRLDAEILAAVKRRTEVSQVIGKARMASGGTRLVHSREMKVIERYSELAPRAKTSRCCCCAWAAAASATERSQRSRQPQRARSASQPRRQPLHRFRRRVQAVACAF